MVLCSISVAFGAVTTADDLAGQLSTGWTSFTENDYILGVPSDMSNSWYAKYGNKTLKSLQSINYQLSGNTYNSTSGNNLFTFVNNINQSLNSPNTGIYGLLQTQNLKLDSINTTLGTGSSISNVLTKLDAIVNWTSNTNSGVQSLVTNGIDINAPALDDIFDLLNTPVLEPFTYVYRSAINTNGSFTSSSNNGYVVGIRTDENTGALRFGQQTLNSQMDYLGIIHNDLLGLNNRLQTMATEYNPVLYGDDGTPYSYKSFSIMDSLTMYGNNHGRMLNDILQSIDNYTSSFASVYYRTRNSQDSKSAITTGTLYSYRMPVLSIYNGMPVLTYGSSDGNMSLVDRINIINTNLAETSTLIMSPQTQYSAVYTTGEGITESYNAISIADFLQAINESVVGDLSKIKYIVADDESIQAKKDNASQTSAVITNFTGSGQASATANDYGTLSSGVNDVKGGMTTNVSPNYAFDIFNNQSGYSFWSSETLNELNQSGNSQRNVFKSDISDDYTFYSNRLQYLFDIMNGGDKK